MRAEKRNKVICCVGRVGYREEVLLGSVHPHQSQESRLEIVLIARPGF